jgi:hypothetical protein
LSAGATSEKPNRRASLRVFLCHCTDDKAAVRQLFRRLRASGVDPWLDEDALLPGQEWEREIARAVRLCDVVLVCLSPRSITKTGYVQKEIRYALDVADEYPEGSLFIIPVKFEPCEVPDRLRRWQWVDLFDPRGHRQLMNALRARARSVSIAMENSGTRSINSTTDVNVVLALNQKQRQAVEKMTLRYAGPTSLQRGRIVANSSHQLFAALQTVLRLQAATCKLLEAAAYLLEIGTYISRDDRRKHSFYLVLHSKLGGFTEEERVIIAILCRFGGESFPKPWEMASHGLGPEERYTVMRLIPLLRLAENLNGTRSDTQVAVEFKLRNGRLLLEVHSDGDLQVAKKGVRLVRDAFREVYDTKISVVRHRTLELVEELPIKITS